MLLWIRSTDFDKFVVQIRCGRESESRGNPLEMRHKFVKKRVSKQLDLEIYRTFAKERLRHIISLQNSFLRVEPWIDKKLSLKYGRSKVTTPNVKQ